MIDRVISGRNIIRIADTLRLVESDRRTLALYVLGCDPLTYSPETAEVMDRMRPLLLGEDGKLLDGSPGCEDVRIGGVVDELDDNPFEETSL